MGYSITPTYAVKFTVPGQHWTPAAWDCKRSGRPSAATLATYVARLEASTAPGGCNAHLGAVVVSTARRPPEHRGDGGHLRGSGLRSGGVTTAPNTGNPLDKP